MLAYTMTDETTYTVTRNGSPVGTIRLDGAFYSAYGVRDNFLGSSSRSLGIENAVRNQFGTRRPKWGRRGH